MFGIAYGRFSWRGRHCILLLISCCYPEKLQTAKTLSGKKAQWGRIQNATRKMRQWQPTTRNSCSFRHSSSNRCTMGKTRSRCGKTYFQHVASSPTFFLVSSGKNGLTGLAAGDHRNAQHQEQVTRHEDGRTAHCSAT